MQLVTMDVAIKKLIKRYKNYFMQLGLYLLHGVMFRERNLLVIIKELLTLKKYSMPTSRYHVQRMKHISNDKIITNTNCLMQRKTPCLLLSQRICVDATKRGKLPLTYLTPKFLNSLRSFHQSLLAHFQLFSLGLPPMFQN